MKKEMKKIFITLLVTGTFLGASASAQNKLLSDPGYVDVRAVESWFGSEPNLEVNIQGALLKLVAEASRFEDPELASLILKLKGISVRGYNVEGMDLQSVKRQTREMGRKLESDGWETIVRVREDDESVDMYLRTVNDAIAGMVVMVIDDDEDAVFVNIIGEIDPEQIGRLGQKFNFGSVDRF